MIDNVGISPNCKFSEDTRISQALTTPDDLTHVLARAISKFYESHQEFFIIIHLHTHLKRRKNKPLLQRIFKSKVKPQSSISDARKCSNREFVLALR